MEKIIKPDRKYLVVSFWVHLTASVSLILLTSIIHLIVILANGDMAAMKVVWIICTVILIITWIIVFPLVQIWINKLSYIIGNDRITIHKGIITKTQQNIPYRAITDFALKRGLYDRLMGIGSIQVQTAGQSRNATGYEGSLSGLLNYNELLTELRKKLSELHPVSEAVTVSETIGDSNQNVLNQILAELIQIRKALEK